MMFDDVGFYNLFWFSNGFTASKGFPICFPSAAISFTIYGAPISYTPSTSWSNIYWIWFGICSIYGVAVFFHKDIQE